MQVAQALFDHVRITEPNVYFEILHVIRPHSLKSLTKHVGVHLKQSVPRLEIFNNHPDKIGQFLLAFVRAIRKQFPSPGEAFGIQLTCRITKSDTQGTLDSKHLDRKFDLDTDDDFNVEYRLGCDLDLFTIQSHVFEMATRRKFSTAYIKPTPDIHKQLPNACLLKPGMPSNQALDARGELGYIDVFRFIVIEDGRVLYRSMKDLVLLTMRLDGLVAISDIRLMFEKCGIVSYFFNLMKIIDRRLCLEKGTVFERDVMTIVKYQCRTGRPLPLTRDGLAKNAERSPIEVLSFEAPKSNYARLCTLPQTRYDVYKSTDKIIFGQQFNEGTGYCKFEVRGESR